MNYYTNQILKEKKITTFLEERGIYPVRKTGDKFIYRCPVHVGDNDPSFVVYPEGIEDKDYQTYYCFGCHSGTTIINLKKDIDSVSFKESVKFFLKDIKIDIKGERESIIDDIQKDELEIDNKKKIETLLLEINSTCRDHLLSYNDEEEIDFFENFFKEVDRIARTKNTELLEKISDLLHKGNEKRAEKFQERQEENYKSALAWRL